MLCAFESAKAKSSRYAKDRSIAELRLQRVSRLLQNAVDKALYKANTAILVGTSTWLEQFKQAFSVKGKVNGAAPSREIDFSSDDDDDNNDVVDSSGSHSSEGKPPTCKDYMIHFVSFFWKFLFAFVPPTSKEPARDEKLNETHLIRYGGRLGLLLCLDFHHWLFNGSHRRFSYTRKRRLFVDAGSASRSSSDARWA